jgi:hypothetical protein
MHKVNTLHAQYTTLTECGIVVTCHIRLLLYNANGVKEPVVSSHGAELPSNIASSDVETLRYLSLLFSPNSRMELRTIYERTAKSNVTYSIIVILTQIS